MGDRLSVVVPVHDAVQEMSVFAATVRANASDGVRFLLVDDGSSDGTGEVLEAIAARVPHISVSHHSSPHGAAASRNAALERVSTRYVTFLDADDWCAPGRMASLLESIELLGVDFVRTDHVRVIGDRRRLERAPEGRRGVPVPAEEGIGDAGGKAMVDYPFLWAGAFDLERIGARVMSFDPTLATASDRPFFWRLHLQSETFAVVDAPWYYYRKDEVSGSLTNRPSESLLDFIPAYYAILELAETSGVANHRRRAAYGAYRIVAFHLEKRNRLSLELQKRLVAEAKKLLLRIREADGKAACARLDVVSRSVLDEHGALPGGRPS